jgi:ribosome-binding protein aMBF1 (putative translation factor)
MTKKTLVSPIGTSAADVAQERAARSAKYRAERDRLAFWADIAAQIILYRTRRGISQKKLADRVGTSHSAISRLESGQHAASVETLRRIGQALGQELRVRFEPLVDVAEPVREPERSRRLVTA